MARTKLTEQPQYEFCYPITLQPRDINYGGHLGVDSLVSIVAAARAYIFKSIGLSEGNLGNDRAGIIMTDFTVNLKAQGFMFDNLEVYTHIGELTKTGFRFFHKITRESFLIAIAEAGFLAYDYIGNRVTSVPEEFTRQLGLSRQL
jgi:acyl-CoA thioesterase FadM